MRRLAPAVLALVSTGAAILAAVVLASGPLVVERGPLKFSAATPGRPVVLGVIAALALLIVWRRHPAWRRTAIGLLIALAPLALLLGRQPNNFPFGDGAIIELYTLFALKGQLYLGAYSQYLWHHPGPLSFYVFAPFYLLGGYSSFGLGVGVLFVNLGSLGLVAWLLARERTMRWPFTAALFGLLLIFYARVPGALTSGWNPHTPLLPLVALLFVATASLNGNLRLLPLAAALTSFIIQTHIGFSMVAGLLFLAALAPLLWVAWRDPVRRATCVWWMVGTVFLLELLWAPPLAEQLVKSPGNMTLIVRFFFSGPAEQTLLAAWNAWGTMLAGVFWPSLVLAGGNPLIVGDEVWPRLLGTGFVVLLVPAGFAAWRAGRTFTAWLAAASLIAAIGGFWSVTHVRGAIGDYHIFWLAPLGVVNAAVAIAELVAILRFLPAPSVEPRLIPGIVAVGTAAIAAIGIGPFFSTKSFDVEAEGATIRRMMFETRQGLLRLQAKHPVVRFDEGVWSTGAGFVLQLQLEGVDVSIAPEMIWLLGDQLAADGGEDVLLTVSRPGRHAEIVKRPHNITLADAETYFVDAVSLIDAPEARPPLK